jgi:hypothetical protein
VAWSVVDYVDLPADDHGETIVPKRLRKRKKAVQVNSKILVKGDLADRNVFIDAGQHRALIDRQAISAHSDQQVTLAHYFRRSPWQHISKSVLGYLKVLAAGEVERQQNRSVHYKGLFEAVRDNPKSLLAPHFLEPTYDGELIEDPLPYLGGALRYTTTGDPMLKAMRVLTAYAEQLALHHGMFIDTNQGVRLQAEQATSQWRLLF